MVQRTSRPPSLGSIPKSDAGAKAERDRKAAAAKAKKEQAAKEAKAKREKAAREAKAKKEKAAREKAKAEADRQSEGQRRQERSERHHREQAAREQAAGKQAGRNGESVEMDQLPIVRPSAWATLRRGLDDLVAENGNYWEFREAILGPVELLQQLARHAPAALADDQAAADSLRHLLPARRRPQ